MQLSIAPRGVTRFLSSALLALAPLSPLSWAQAQAAAQSNKPIVFLIVIENKNSVGTGGVYGSPKAPYINHTLFPMAAVANNYFNPPGQSSQPSELSVDGSGQELRDPRRWASEPASPEHACSSE